MAIRKIKDKYYIYYRHPETQRYKTLPTGTGDALKAKQLDAMFMSAIASGRALAIILDALPGKPQGAPCSDSFSVVKQDRFLLKNAIEIASKSFSITTSGRKLWKRFLTICPYKYFDELTPQNVNTILKRLSPKSFNNMISACNRIFKLCAIDVGLTTNPFGQLTRREVTGKRQRAFTEAEFKAMLTVAEEPWKTAMLISWFTGLRKKDAFSVGWANVVMDDVIDTTPFKTKNKGIRVFVPIHSQLFKWVEKWKKRKEPWTFCAKAINVFNGNYKSDFSAIMKKANIIATQDEDLNFDCLRNSYIDRMANFGIPEDIRKQIVGHTQTQTHDHYRGFIEASRIIQQMPKIDI